MKKLFVLVVMFILSVLFAGCAGRYSIHYEKRPVTRISGLRGPMATGYHMVAVWERLPEEVEVKIVKKCKHHASLPKKEEILVEKEVVIIPAEIAEVETAPAKKCEGCQSNGKIYKWYHN